MPPIIGYAAAAGAITREAWVLAAILFLWQFPHFYSIAWMYKEDYARAGIRMLPVVEPDCRSTARQIVLFGLALIPVSLIPGMLGMSGRIYSDRGVVARHVVSLFGRPRGAGTNSRSARAACCWLPCFTCR